MANLKQIRKHILSVQKTGKITKAMKMVAVSKLRKSQQAVVATRPYVNELINIIEHLVIKADTSGHPLLRSSAEKKNCAVIVISGDKGLCGAYNHNVVRTAKRFLEERKENGANIKMIFVGHKAYDALRKFTDVEKKLIPGAWEMPPSALGLELSKALCEDFAKGELDEVYVIYTMFKSAISQNVVLDAVLPLQSILYNAAESEGGEVDEQVIAERRAKIDQTYYIYEPSNAELLDVLLPRAVSIHLHRSILESAASEHGARMTAMDNASTNAEEMIGALTLKYNRARQAAITTELIEVVSGAEALK